jgi:hypothetical protein
MSISEDTAAIVAAISSLTDAVGQLTGAVQGLRHTDRPVTSLGDLIGNMLSSIAQKVPIPPGFGEGTHPARGPDLDFDHTDDDALDVLKGHDDELCRCMHARRVHVGGDGPCVVGDAACICNTFTLLGPVEKVDEADEEDELAAARMKEMRPAIIPIESGGTPCRVCGLQKCQCLGVLMSTKPKETP